MDIVKSKDNPNIKLYQKLAASKKERLKYGMFVLEGLRIVKDAVKEKRVEYLLITEQAFEKYQSEFSQADLNNARFIVISNELGNKISQTEKTQGIFAVCNLPEKKILDFKNNSGKYIVLVNVQDPGNMGMIIRTADALGIDGIIISDCCDLYSPKVIRSTMGSVFRTEIFDEPDLNKLFSAMNQNNIKSYAAVIENDAYNIKDIDFGGGCAVFIGNEGNGLPDEVSSECTAKITIPMQGTINSLNAAMAAGIMMWELKRNE